MQQTVNQRRWQGDYQLPSRESAALLWACGTSGFQTPGVISALFWPPLHWRRCRAHPCTTWLMRDWCWCMMSQRQDSLSLEGGQRPCAQRT